MKRKAAEAGVVASNGPDKKQAIETDAVRKHFREDLFLPEIIKQHENHYAQSEPYKHAVVSDLINDTLLRGVRNEILEHIHFTPKETDIYKIHQSGDLANLSGLPTDALIKLPSLLQLRNALYSPAFRAWISEVSGAGALSGQKTDMAVNVYAPGCHLLCHDDVIGSRRVSYILYLTNPDKPWRAEWGGALRLYPTQEMKHGKGTAFKIPNAEWVRSIPPAWNQLSFFAVQPGESFHDVEEVYNRAAGDDEDDGGRTRMAISGWFHIPQEGEDGYEPGLEDKLAEKSSLQQLQGKAEMFDLPQPVWNDYKDQIERDMSASDDEGVELNEEDLEFLLQFMTPNYLTPDTVEELTELFAEECSLQLTDFLNKKFAKRLRERIDRDEPFDSHRQHLTSRPPHKHRFQYLQPLQDCRIPSASNGSQSDDVYEELLNSLLPSLAFRKWLSLITDLRLGRSETLARRFRRGLDYQLATGYEGENPQLEYCLCVTPSTGWAGDSEAEENGTSNSKDKDAEDEDNVGGYELYMEGDSAAADDDNGSDDGVAIPANAQSQTGAGERRSAKRKKADPAIYQAAADDEDDGILFSNPASWNTMSIVLRDRGVLKFVKYVSKAAKGDRFDFCGSVDVEDKEEYDDDNDDDKDGEGASAGALNSEHASGKINDAQEENEVDDKEEEWAGID